MHKITHKHKKGFLTSILVIIVIAVVALLGYATWNYLNAITPQKQGAVIPSPNQQSSQQGSGTTIITTNPTISVSAYERSTGGGTSVTNSLSGSINGAAFSTLSSTSIVPGQTLEMVVINNTKYHNAHVGLFTAKVDSFPVSVPMDANASVTENIYNTTQTILTNGVGANNQSDRGNGAAYTFKDEMQAGSASSTNDMTCVIEVTAGVNLTTATPGISLSEDGTAITGSTSKPSWYSLASTNSVVYLFDVPAMNTTALHTLSIGVYTLATGRLPAASEIKKTCYTKEWFVDSQTGKVTYAVADSAGGTSNVKSMNQYSYTWYFI